MIRRALAEKIRSAAGQFSVVTLTGPRQSGKTTLVRSEFAGHQYASLELPDERAFALEDPRGFLGQFKGPVILDEVQRAPELFSYIQALVDEDRRPGRFILTGSQNFLLLQSVSQSLAGRAAVLHLLPFSLSELEGRPPVGLAELGAGSPAAVERPDRDLFATLHVGFYPPIHDRGIAPRDWLAAYHQTYLERDVRSILQVGDLEAFGRFLRLAAGRNGQLLDLSSLASDCGISHSTAKRWLSVLEASFLVALLRPHFRNFGKRLIKSPKLYFLDTGLLCHLLRIGSPDELRLHASRGAVFESYVLSELHKNFVHRGEQPGLHFWRDSAGHEVDFLIEHDGEPIPVEAKSGETLAGDFLEGLEFWRGLSGRPEGPAALVYGGDQGFLREGVAVRPWFAL